MMRPALDPDGRWARPTLWRCWSCDRLMPFFLKRCKVCKEPRP